MSRPNRDQSHDQSSTETDADGVAVTPRVYERHHVQEYDYDPTDPESPGGVGFWLDAGARALPEAVDPPTIGESDDLAAAGALPEFYASLPSAMQAFRDRIAIRASFIPFASRCYNQLRVLHQVASYVETLRPTVQYVRRNDFARKLPIFNTGRDPAGTRQGHQNASSVILDRMLILHGLYPIAETPTAASRAHYANPEYVHHHTYTALTDPDERADWLARYARTPFVPAAQIGRHFGVRVAGAPDVAPESDEWLADVIARADVDWHAERALGWREFGRTLATCRVWGYDDAVLAHVFGTTEAAIERAVRVVATRGFSPPAVDPTVPHACRDQFSHAAVDVTADAPAPVERRVREHAPTNTVR